MWQIVAGKMIPVIYLVVIAGIATHAVHIPLGFSNTNTTNETPIFEYQDINVEQQIANSALNITEENAGDVQDDLDEAEQLIKLAKVKISKKFQEIKPTDCEDILKNGQNDSGVYLIWPNNRILKGPISVYCDMETDGGGWTVIQRRGDFLRDKNYFYQNWKAYKEGFGNLKEDFWLGNDNIYALSSQKQYSIRFELGAFDKRKAYAFYSLFWIDDEYNNYRIHLSGFSGTAGDAMGLHNECKFSTKDRDNDNSSRNCAEVRKGAWWFDSCVHAHLNGQYYRGKTPEEWDGIIWKTWRNSESLASTEMKIRKKSTWVI